jgi:hypothetical protein
MVDDGRNFWDLRIPYLRKYAYRETLAVGAPDSAEELVAAYEKLALQLLALAPEGSRARELGDAGPEATRSEPLLLPTVSNIPARIPLVVCRQKLLSEMRSRLTDTASPLVLHGLGGVGKTTLAVEYAHRFQPGLRRHVVDRRDVRGEHRRRVHRAGAARGASAAAPCPPLGGATRRARSA